MKEYGFSEDSTHSAIIYEKRTKAHANVLLDVSCSPFENGLIVGSSEWGWIAEDDGRRICAALEYFSEIKTEEIEKIAKIGDTERMAKERLKGEFKEKLKEWWKIRINFIAKYIFNDAGYFINTRYFTISKYIKDIRVDEAKDLHFPSLRGTWIPSIDLQCGWGFAINWLGLRFKLSDKGKGCPVPQARRPEY